MKRTSRVEGVVYRQATVDAVLDEEERTVAISFSSEIPILRQSFFREPWIEILGHKKSEVNLERLNGGATLHYNHSRQRADRLGAVRSAKLKERRGEAVVQFSQRDDVNDVWEDVRSGLLSNVSVGYSIDERTLTRESNQGEPAEYRVTRWTPMELSFVDIPADHTVGAGRDVEGMIDDSRTEDYRVIDINNSEEDEMRLQRLEGESDEDLAARQAAEDARVAAEEEARRNTPSPTPSPEPDDAAIRAAADRAREEGIRAEAVRREGITNALNPFASRLGDGFVAFRDGLLNDPKIDIETARARLLDELGQDTQPASNDVQVVETSAEKFRDAAKVAIQLRAGILSGDTPQEQRVIADEVRGFSLFEMARRCLELEGAGNGLGRLSRMDLVARAFTTSDFPLILIDAANNAMLKGFDEAPETWETWAQIGNLSDFKVGNRAGLSAFDDLELVNEAGEYKYGTFSEQGETIQLATYGKLFSISRQAIINDDLNAFTAIPSRMGRAASRTVGDLAYGAITANALMTDGVAFFAGTAIGTTHGNLNIGGAAVISEASLGQARQGMARQSDANSAVNATNIRPSYLIVPMALEDRARVMMSSEFNPDEGATTSFRAPNVARGTLEVVTDARLDVDSATRWYVAASQQFDTIEVAFLDGQRAPMLEQQQGWTVDGSEFKVRIDVGVSPTEYRTWQRNDGA